MLSSIHNLNFPPGSISFARDSLGCTRVIVEKASRKVVVIAGGWTAPTALATVDIYDIASGTWYEI